MIWRLIFSTSFLFSIFQTSAFACSCAQLGPAPCAGISKSEVIFVGTVMEVENPATEKREDQGGISRYKFRVDEVLSGVDRTVGHGIIDGLMGHIADLLRRNIDPANCPW